MVNCIIGLVLFAGLIGVCRALGFVIAAFDPTTRSHNAWLDKFYADHPPDPRKEKR